MKNETMSKWKMTDGSIYCDNCMRGIERPIFIETRYHYHADKKMPNVPPYMVIEFLNNMDFEMEDMCGGLVEFSKQARNWEDYFNYCPNCGAKMEKEFSE